MPEAMSTEKNRCAWCLAFPQYVEYHDQEWGVPVWDDQKQFEFLILESAQAALSWATILKKRENYRKAFLNFSPEAVAEMNEDDVQSLMAYSGIIRNEAKIRAAINNAQRFLEIQKIHGSFSRFIWDYVGGKQIDNKFAYLHEVPATTAISDALAKDMKKFGFKFLGSTTLYAHMQATGLVNDHLVTCFRYHEIKELNKNPA